MTQNRYSKLNWSTEEQKLLKTLVQSSQYRSWKFIASSLNMQFPNRIKSGKQCRQRYMNFGRFDQSSPRIKGWTKEEDKQLFYQYIQYGPKWAQLCYKFPGRSQNCLKNRFYGALRKISRKLNKLSFKKSNKINYKKKYIRPQNLSKLLNELKLIRNMQCLTQQQYKKKQICNQLLNVIIQFSSNQNEVFSKEELINFYQKLNMYFLICLKKPSNFLVNEKYLKKSQKLKQDQQESENAQSYKLQPCIAQVDNQLPLNDSTDQRISVMNDDHCSNSHLQLGLDNNSYINECNLFINEDQHCNFQLFY